MAYKTIARLDSGASSRTFDSARSRLNHLNAGGDGVPSTTASLRASCASPASRFGPTGRLYIYTSESLAPVPNSAKEVGDR
jgi:hypothetical protein